MIFRAVCLALFVLPTHALASEKYNLPMEFPCNGESTYAVGAAICAQKEFPEYLKVKIPPTRGQLRVVDCNEDLTVDKNPDDFNLQFEKKGWWIFSRKVQVLSNTPMFPLPRRSFDDCAIVASVAGDKTGIQTGILIYDSRDMESFAEMACAAQPFYTAIDKVAICKELSGARVSIRSQKKVGTVQIVGTGCGIKQMLDLSKGEEANFKLGDGPCVVDVRWITPEAIKLSRILLVGQDRASRELDSPLMVKDGSLVKIYKPLGATIVSTEIYEGSRVVWRSGIRDQEVYALNPEVDNEPGAKSWKETQTMCHTAYSDVLNSTSVMCYNPITGKEVYPYTFR